MNGIPNDFQNEIIIIIIIVIIILEWMLDGNSLRILSPWILFCVFSILEMRNERIIGKKGRIFAQEE